MTTHEPTEEQIALVSGIVDKVLDRMVSHGTEVSNAYNSERIKKLGDRMDKASEAFKRMQATIGQQDEQIHELRRKVDKIRGVGQEQENNCSM